jgi:hypothetical protein
MPKPEYREGSVAQPWLQPLPMATAAVGAQLARWAASTLDVVMPPGRFCYGRDGEIEPSDCLVAIPRNVRRTHLVGGPARRQVQKHEMFQDYVRCNRVGQWGSPQMKREGEPVMCAIRGGLYSELKRRSLSMAVE